MKTRRNIYLTIGLLLMIVNILIDIQELPNILKEIKSPGGIAYLIGYHFIFFIGILLINSSTKINKKMKLRDQIKNIDDIGGN